MASQFALTPEKKRRIAESKRRAREAEADYDPTARTAPSRAVPVRPKGSLTAPKPGVREAIRGGVIDLGSQFGLSPSKARYFGDIATDVADIVPGIGETVGTTATAEALQNRDWRTAALEGGGLALGAIPIVGDIGSKLLREKGKEALAEAMAPAITKTMKHPVSRNVLKRPLEEMTSTFEPGPPLLPQQDFNFEDVPMGSWFVPFLGDRTRAGGRLTGVNEMSFADPVTMQGGSDFMRGPQQQADQAIWASDKPVITTLQNRIRRLQETGNPVYGAHVAMASEAGDYSSQTTNTLLQMIKSGKVPLSQEAKDAFNLAMRSDWGKDFPAVPDFPGIDKITPEWLATAGIGRTKIAKLMDQARFQKLGFPDVGSARKAVTVPELLNVPTGATGHNIVRVGPEAVGHITNPKVPHADYAAQLAKGSYAGSTKPVPADVFWSDWMKTRPAGEDMARTMYSFGRQPVVQQKTQEWLERLMNYKMSEEGKKLGLAGAIGAGLITSSEAKELFGYDET